MSRNEVQKSNDVSPQAAFGIEAAARYCGVRPWTIQEAIYDGRLIARPLGRYRIILRKDLDAFLEALPTVPPSVAPSLVRRRKSRMATCKDRAA